MEKNLSVNKDSYVIQGGKVLQGEVEVSGAKNAVLPILAACLLSRGQCVLHNVPKLADVAVMLTLLVELGAKITEFPQGVVVDSSKVLPVAVSPEIVGKMRASSLVLGPILARFNEAAIAYPGGCSIGSRPLDYHLAAFTKMGAKIIQGQGEMFAFTTGLKAASITLPFPSVGATENIMMAAALADGETVILNSAREPEIVDLANFINAMGGKIRGAGTSRLLIQGVKCLGGAEYAVMPDRIEAGTLLLAGAMTGGRVLLQGTVAADNQALVEVLQATGAKLILGGDYLGINACSRLNCVDVQTLPYPDFPTDLQPQYMALMAISQGDCVISETLFESRFKQAEQLKKMGAKIKITGNLAVVSGVDILQGAAVSATDLRAGAALVLAGLAAEGVTCVENLHYIDRGYEKFEWKLGLLGAKVQRTTSGRICDENIKQGVCKLFKEKPRVVVV